jgi:actin-related protein 8
MWSYFSSIQLLAGGNDVTEFLFVLLQRVGFPYKDANLARTYDWAMLEQLKRSMCSLNEVCSG